MLNVKKMLTKLAETLYANNKVEIGTITGESNISIVTSDSFYFKTGNICRVQLRFMLNSATTTNTKIATLPEGFRPRVNSSNGVICQVLRLWGYNATFDTAYIQNNGNVMLSANYPAIVSSDYLLTASFVLP